MPTTSSVPGGQMWTLHKHMASQVSPCIHRLEVFFLLTSPENQVTPFNVTTPDNEILYAWHVLPLNIYEKHEAELFQVASGSPNGDFTQTKAFELLKNDPKARLIINCKDHSPFPVPEPQTTPHLTPSNPLKQSTATPATSPKAGAPRPTGP